MIPRERFYDQFSSIVSNFKAGLLAWLNNACCI